MRKKLFLLIIFLCSMLIPVSVGYATAGGIWRCVACTCKSETIDIAGIERLLTLRLNGSGEGPFIMEIFYPQEERLDGYWKEKQETVSLNFKGKEKDVTLTLDGDYLYYQRGDYIYSLVYDTPANKKYFEETDIITSFARRDLNSDGNNQSEEQTKPTKLTWGMSKTEAKKIAGTPVNTSLPIRPGMEMLAYKDQRISEFTGADMLLCFRNDQLFSRQYTLTNDKGTLVFSYLGEALDNLYGSSENNIAVATQYFNLFLSNQYDDESASKRIRNMNARYKAWQTEDTNILLFHVESDSEAYTLLSYTMTEETLPIKVYNYDGL